MVANSLNHVSFCCCCGAFTFYRSYGVLLWEIASFAIDVPYGKMQTKDVIEAISSGRIVLERCVYVCLCVLIKSSPKDVI